MPKGLGNIGDPLPGNDGNEQDDANGETQVGGSRSKNISELVHWRRIYGWPALLIEMKFHCLILLSDPIPEPLVFRILAIWRLMYLERRKSRRP
jgi:hypothetical protein